MSCAENSYEINEASQCFLGEALARHPQLPVGIANIESQIAAAQLSSVQPTEPGYALDQVPAWIAKILSTYDEIGRKPIVGLDVCSSLPRYAQRLRMHEIERDGERARDIEKSFRSPKTIAELAKESEQLKAVAEVASDPRKSASVALGRLLNSAIQEVLYTITPEESALTEKGPSEALMKKLKDRIASQRMIRAAYHVNHEIRFDEVDAGLTYLEAVSELEIPSPVARFSRLLLALPSNNPTLDRATAKQDKVKVGDELAQQYVDWQANHLAHFLAGNPRFRPARFFSMDSADPGDIAISSIQKSPDQARSSVVFSHAIKSLDDRYQHIRGNIFEPLPFPDNSLAIITCFDGWPFHFQLDDELHKSGEDFSEVALQTLMNWYKKLAYGGKIVVFPWSVKTENHEDEKAAKRVLDAVEVRTAKEIDHSVSSDVLHRDTIARYMMSPADIDASMSGVSILTSANEHFKVLIINKPAEGSVANIEKRISRHLHRSDFSADQAPDSPSPTP